MLCINKCYDIVHKQHSWSFNELAVYVVVYYSDLLPILLILQICYIIVMIIFTSSYNSYNILAECIYN